MLTIAILAIDNCIHSTVTGSLDILSIASTHFSTPNESSETFCDAGIVLPTTSPVRTFNGTEITGHHSITEKRHYDIIILPALIGDIAPILDQQTIINWIGRQHQDGSCICSVCASAFLVAAAGLLDGREATTHWALAREFRNKFPDVLLKPEKMIVDGGDVITAGGVTAYLDLCLHIINRFGSQELA
jgi:transcriptional regulator GlxA family with amidase domain